MSYGVVSIRAEKCVDNVVLLTSPQLLLTIIMCIGPVWYNLPSAGKSSDTPQIQIIKQVSASIFISRVYKKLYLLHNTYVMALTILLTSAYSSCREWFNRFLAISGELML